MPALPQLRGNATVHKDSLFNKIKCRILINLYSTPFRSIDLDRNVNKEILEEGKKPFDLDKTKDQNKEKQGHVSEIQF